MSYRLSKTDYIRYLNCSQEFWLRHHQPLLFSLTLESDHLFRQGNDVQRIARNHHLFRSDQEREVIFEHTLQTADHIARCDVFVSKKGTTEAEIYEIKATTDVKTEHYDDLAFQKMVAEANGWTITRCHLVHINNEYVRSGDIDAEQLFKIVDITDKVNEQMEITRRQSREALDFLLTDLEPSLVEYANSKHDRKTEFNCAAIKAYFPDLPDYTVFHVPRIHKPKLIALLEMGVIDLRDIPDSFDLTVKQWDYIETAKSTQVAIQHDEIRRRMDEWEYPLHFLDYETFSYAIPQFDGLRPFQQMCFQYSLHTIDSPGAPLRHSEYLARRDEPNPPLALAEHLKNAMAGSIGTVFVWYESFEKTRNSEMAEMFPEYAPFFEEVNAKTVDLMKIFADRLYIHPDFKGRSSIKKVLPVLCPHVPKYEDLGIGEGLTASISWFRAVRWESMSDHDREHIFQNLLEYCELDTRAMVDIYEVLKNI